MDCVSYSSSVTPEQRTQYAAIIDTILREGDLNTISEKKIRKALSEKLGYDVSHQKVLCLEHYVLLLELTFETENAGGGQQGYHGTVRQHIEDHSSDLVR